MKRKLLYLVFAMFAVFYGESARAQITTFPYAEDFESFVNCGTGCGAACVLANNWFNDLGDNLDWLTDEGGTSSTSTGPAVDANPGTATGHYLYVETSCSGTGYPNMTANLHSPYIDLTGTNAVQFEFKYHMYGTSMGVMHVDVSPDNGATWVNDVIPSWTDNLDAWQQASVDLSAWTGLTQVIVRIRFISGSSFGSDAAVDDVRIYDLLADDAGVSAFINPNVPTCVFNDSVSVTLTNYGTDSLFNAGIEWEWNAAAQTPYAWTGALASGESETVYIGSVAYGAGDNLKAWSTLPNGVIEIPSGAGNDTTELLNLQTGLSGTYTIGGVAPDYLDFASAIADLSAFGVCGPTIFDVRSGTYNEQVSLSEVINMDATNNVTFRSEAGHRDSVTLTFASFIAQDNYTLQFNGGDYFNFEQMTIEATGVTYGRVLDYRNISTNNTVWDCRVVSNINTTTSTNACVIYSEPGSNDNYNSFIGNTIEGGSYGAYWYGIGTASLEEGTVFENNEFLNNYYYGARLYYQDGSIFNGNRFETNSAYTGTMWAFYFFYLDNGGDVSGNTVVNKARYGLYFGNCDATSASRLRVSNNMLHVGDPADANTFYGIYLTNTGYTDIYNNSVNVEGTSTSSRAFYGTSGGANHVYNNNFVNMGDGYAAYIASNYTVVEMDYNNLYTMGTNVGYFNNTNQATLTDWQNASGFDGNGVNVDPGYYSASDLHVCSDAVDGLAMPTPLVTEDIDGQARTATPDIGADEFIPAGQPLLGPDQLICTGETLNLFAGAPADTVIWSTGDTSQMISVTTPGTYYVSVDGACGMGTDTIVVTQSNLDYTGFLVADDTLFCEGDSTYLYSNMVADSYLWNTAATIPQIPVNVSGTYTLDISDACGSGSESVDITVETAPIAGFTYTGSYASADFTSTSTGTYNTYLWDFGDGTTSTEQDPEHIFATTGPHTITLTVSNACGIDTYTTTISMVGMDELTNGGNVAVYPNPSEGIINLDMNTLVQSNVNIAVENMLGEIVYFNEAGSVEGSYSQVIDLTNESTGMYFVHVNVDGERFTKKVVIK